MSENKKYSLSYTNGVCERDTGINWKSFQWPKTGKFELTKINNHGLQPKV